MRSTEPKSRKTGMQPSPWIILGSTVILVIVVIVLAIQNTRQEKNAMVQILHAKGAALIRAVEAGARTGMMGMMWGEQQIQRLLEETGSLPDVKYMAVVNDKSVVVAHSDPAQIGKTLHPNEQLIHLGPDLIENWGLVHLSDGQQVFEVHRYFRPLQAGAGTRFGHMRGSIRYRRPEGQADWFAPQNRQHLLIVAGLDVAPFEAAIHKEILTTVIFSIILLLLGFGGFVSLFWMHSYRIAKRSLQDTSAFADEVVTHLPVGLIATDNQGRITFYNEAAEKITGLQAQIAIGREPDKALPMQLCGIKEKLDKGLPIAEQEMNCTFDDGRSVPLSISATRIINEEGYFVGQILILRDLREVRRLQAEVRRQEKLAALGGLAAGVAHEIRNPLSSIKGLATYFATQFEAGSEAKEATDVMIQEVDRLNRAITELLDFARPTDLKPVPTDIEPLISRSLQLIQQDAAAHGVQIQKQIDDALCLPIMDPDRVTQCLLNIYMNALQAMPDGGHLNVGCRLINSDQICIAVSDTGYGIPSEHLNKIFDPYFTTKNKGTGLGLAIVHKIVEAHQGSVLVESSSGRGTTVKLVLPCRSAEDSTTL